MFCGTKCISRNIFRIKTEREKYHKVLCEILSVPYNIVMDLNNVM